MQRMLIFFTLSACILLSRTSGGEPVKIAVLEFTSKGGVTQDQMDALSEMVVNLMGQMKDLKVIDKATIRQVLNLEEQKALLSSCSDQVCLSEIGGALGVHWVLAGNVSQFGSAWLMNLRIVDVRKVEIAAGVSRSISGGQEQLIAELPKVVAELFSAARGPMGLDGASERPGVAQQAPVEAAPPAAPEVRAPADTEAPAGGGWFSTSAKRRHRWTISASGGFMSVERINYSGDPSVVSDLTSESGLDMNNPRSGLLAGAMGAFGITEWLEARLWLGGGIAGDRQGYWTHRYLEIDSEFAFYWPTSFWIAPYFFLSLGFCSLWSVHDSGQDKFEFRGLSVGAGLGADFHLKPDWFVGVRVSWRFNKYFSAFSTDQNGRNEEDVDAAMNGTSALLTGGYRF